VRSRAAFLPTSGAIRIQPTKPRAAVSCSRLRVRFDVLSTYPNLSFGALYKRRIRDIRDEKRAKSGSISQDDERN